MRQKRLACFQEVDEKRHDDKMFVDLTIYDVPADLLRVRREGSSFQLPKRSQRSNQGPAAKSHNGTTVNTQ